MTLDLDAIKARAEVATPGPWEWDYETLFSEESDPVLRFYHERQAYAGADLIFIAHSRADVDALIAEVERLRAMNRILETEGRNARALLSQADV